MFIMKSISVFIPLLIIYITSFGQETFSFRDILPVGNNIVIVGTYTELIEKQGVPNDSIFSCVGITEYCYLNDNSDSIVSRAFKKIKVQYLVYGDSLRYIKINDSVQINYLDFSISKIALQYRGLIINKMFNFYNAKKYFQLQKHNIRYNDVEYRKEKMVKVKTFGIPTKSREPFDDNLWLVFYKKSNNIWYMDFPLKCEGCIVR